MAFSLKICSTSGRALPVFDVDVAAGASHTFQDIAQADLELFLKNPWNLMYQPMKCKKH